MNKKSLLLIVLSVLLSASIFAADSNTYLVEEVNGKVTYEAAPGTWKNITVGQELSMSTVINTALNASLVVNVNGTKVTIKAMQKGAIDGLASAAGGAKGLKKGPAVAKDTTADASNGSQKGVVTASSRASMSKEDIDWDEE